MKHVKTYKDTASATIFYKWRSTVEQIGNPGALMQDVNALNKAKDMGATHIVT